MKTCITTKKKNFYIMFIILLLLIFNSSFSAEVLTEHSLKAYLLYAREHNPAIKSAQKSVDAQESEYRLSRAIPDPTLSGGYFISEIETRVGPQKGKVGASQMLPWPGKIAQKRKMEKHNLTSAEHMKVSVEAQVYAQIRELYASLYATGQSISINKENLKILQSLESVLLAKYAAGTVKQMDVLKIQVEIAKLEDEIKSLEAEGKKQAEELKSLLNIGGNSKIPYPEAIAALEVPDKQEQIIDEIVQQNPMLKNAHHQTEAAGSGVALARQQFAPDFMIMTDYMFTDESSMDVPDNGKDPWVIGASVTLPIWAGTKADRVKKAEAVREMKKATRDDIENRLIAQGVALHENYRDAQRKVSLFEKVLIPKAKQAFSLSEEAYKNTQASVIDYLDAQGTLLSLEIMLAKQKARAETAASRIDMLLGGKFTMEQIKG